MHLILETFKREKTLHHAYLITGDIDANIASLRGALEKIIGDDFNSYPDFSLKQVAQFAIQDSRELIERQKTFSFGGGMRFFVIAAHSFTTEAQNALLKVLEEPIAGNHFFLLIPTKELLLPTLRSRLLHIEGEVLIHDEIADWCDKFIGGSVVDRLVLVEKLLKAEGDDEENKMAKHKVRDIFDRIEKVFSEKILSRKNEQSQKEAKFLAELIRMKSYLNDKAPSLRLILEYISFICPKIF